MLAVAALGAAVLAQGASADPTNAKSSFSLPASCAGTAVQFVVNGNGEFTPGHVVGSTAVFIPQSFDITFEFTPPGGTTETETDTASKRHPHGDLVTCSPTTPAPARRASVSAGARLTSAMDDERVSSPIVSSLALCATGSTLTAARAAAPFRAKEH